MGFLLDAVRAVHPNGQRAVDSICLRARTGERLALIGSSGAGKTSLLRVLGASLRPSQGHCVLLEGEPWAMSAGELRKLRARIGHLHQAAPIPPRQRVVSAVLAGRLGQWPWWKSLASLIVPADAAGAAAELARLELSDRLYERCDRLSGGQLQRVALARVLYQRPDLILADEPVSAMDPALADLTAALLNQEAQARGVTLVASLHAVDLALRHFPRVVGVKAGRIAFDCAAGEVSEAMLQDLYAAEGDWQRVAVAGPPAPDDPSPALVTVCR